jgi:E3 ubiquitin-protein ligase HUWE1
VSADRCHRLTRRTKISIKWSKSEGSNDKATAKQIDDDGDDDFSSMDEDEDIDMETDEEEQPAPDLYRNSALGM